LVFIVECLQKHVAREFGSLGQATKPVELISKPLAPDPLRHKDTAHRQTFPKTGLSHELLRVVTCAKELTW
jgi:hypothetical protein